MLTKRIIPCFDVADGRVVKGIRFLNLRDAGDPVELARAYNDEGADELVFLDIRASPERRDTAIDMVQRIANEVVIPFTVGGGIRSHEGYDLELTRAVSEAVQVPVIASGGAGKPEHMYEAFVNGKADAALAASIFHFGTHRIRDVKQYLAERDIPVRL